MLHRVLQIFKQENLKLNKEKFISVVHKFAFLGRLFAGKELEIRYEGAEGSH